jgi:hypothetical protein
LAKTMTLDSEATRRAMAIRFKTDFMSELLVSW